MWKPCRAPEPPNPSESRAPLSRQSTARPAERNCVTDRKWAESDAASGPAWSTMGVVVGKEEGLRARPEVGAVERPRNVRGGRGSARTGSGSGRCGACSPGGLAEGLAGAEAPGRGRAGLRGGRRVESRGFGLNSRANRGLPGGPFLLALPAALRGPGSGTRLPWKPLPRTDG